MAFFWSSQKPICTQPVSWITLKSYFMKIVFQSDIDWTRSIRLLISYLSANVLHMFIKFPIILLLTTTKALWFLNKNSKRFLRTCFDSLLIQCIFHLLCLRIDRLKYSFLISIAVLSNIFFSSYFNYDLARNPNEWTMWGIKHNIK